MAARQQGSKAGLFTTLVLVLVGFFVVLFLYWQNLSDVKKSQTELDELKKAVARVILPTELTPALQSPAAGDTRFPRGMPYYKILQAQVSELRMALASQSTTRPTDSVVDAIARIRSELNDKGLIKKYNIPFENRDVISALYSLEVPLFALDQKLTAAEAAQKKAEDDLKATKEAIDANPPFKQAYADAVSQNKQLQEAIAKLDESAKAQIEALIGSLNKKLEDSAKANDEIDDQRKKAEASAAQKAQENEALLQALKKHRPQDLAQAALRRPDGKIVDMGTEGLVYIDISRGIYMGMRFEVYDKATGIPRVGADPDQLPLGKGSLEVIKVDNSGCLCQIMKTEPGQQIRKGDIIANLAYDPDIKWKFAVFGDFDLSGTGRLRNDIQEIKNRITRAGSLVTDKVSVDVSFLVIGREPVLPDIPKDQQDDEDNAYKLKMARKAITDFDAVKNHAQELGIPILNQDMFLALIGDYRGNR